jgi:hypothetical protein
MMIQWIGTILIPAFISFLITYLTNKRQKQLDLTFDYRKYIIEKRKEAYQRVEKFINTFIDSSGIIDLLSKTDKSYVDRINDTNYRMAEIMGDYKIWLSPEISLVMGLLRKRLVEFMIVVNIPNTDMDPMEQRFLVYNKILQVQHMLEEAFFNDIMSMDNIEAFRSKKKKQHIDQHKIFSE